MGDASVSSQARTSSCHRTAGDNNDDDGNGSDDDDGDCEPVDRFFNVAKRRRASPGPTI
jgi:hypothetical protein